MFPENEPVRRSQVITVFDHTEIGGISPEWLRDQGEVALPLCLADPGTGEKVLPDLEAIEVSLLTDEMISEVHGEFLDDPTSTDVITFQHGEILISAETAVREAPSHDNEPAEEALLYLIHGLLHLNGHTDSRDPERSRMHEKQEKILWEVLSRD